METAEDSPPSPSGRALVTFKADVRPQISNVMFLCAMTNSCGSR
jgi:hypothetical protein